MSKIFISHSSINNPEALAVSQWLEDNGWSDYFLDITPTRGLSPGERWQEALKAAANRCEAVLFLISQPWLDSKWCLAEFLLAKNLGKNIFGVLIEDLDLDSLPVEMTGEYQLCDLVHGADRSSFEVQHDPLVPQTKVELSKSGLNLLCTGLKNSGLDANSFPWPPKNDLDRAPYRGLKPLEAKDAAIYFGRDAEIVRGLDELRKLRELGLNKMLVILGASGSGKSSFLGAGLLPRLKRDDRHFLTLPIIRPGRDALNGDRGLVACLEQAFAQYEIKKTRAQIRTFLEQPDGLEGLLFELRDASMKTQGKDPVRPTILISIDQCEELYSADIQAAQLLRAYLGSLLLSKSTQSRDSQSKLHIIVLVTIRTDLYEKLQTDTSFSGIQQHLYNLTPLDPTEYKEIIEGPAEQATKAGKTLEIEPALTARLLADAKGADALPLLAFTLEHLFIEHGSDGDLTLDEYESVGGIQGAVELAVRTALSEPAAKPVIPTDDSEQKKLLRSAFIPWLIEVDDSTSEYKRRIVKWDEIPTETHPLLERLITARLLTRDKRKTAEDQQEEIIVEVAHEALLRRWPTLVQWIEEDSDELRIMGAVVKSATNWEKNQFGDEYLDHKGERLLEAEKIQNRKDLEQRLGETGRAYVKQCRQHEHDQLEKEKQQYERIAQEQAKTRKYQQRAFSILLLLLLLTIGAGYRVFQQALETSEQVSKMLVNESQHAAKANWNQRALKLALLATQENWRTNATPTATVNLAEIAQNFPLETVLTGHSKTVLHASFNPDGTRIVTASRDNTARIWDASTGEPVGQPLQHQSGVTHASFNSDGSRIVTASWDKTARIWNATTGETVGEPLRHKGEVLHPSFNPAGTRIVTASWDNTARIWDATTGEPVGQPLQHKSRVNHASFSPDGSRIVTASSDNTARIWDVATGYSVGQPLQHESSVDHASFNPTGTRIVTVSRRTAWLWDVTAGKQVGQQLQHQGVTYVSFNPAGTRIVTASEIDYTARIWDAASGEPVGQPLQHEFIVTHASFNPSGGQVLTVNRDNTARIWDAITGKPVGQPLQHEMRIEYASFDPSGTRIVTTSWDSIVRVWGVNFEQVVGDHFTDRGRVKNVNPNQAGTQVVVVYKDNTAQIWDTITGQAVGVPLPHSGIGYARFNTDGSRVVTQGDKTIRIWDANTGQPLGVPIQHKGGFSFNPAMTRIVTISKKDGIGLIWDAITGEQVGVPLIHDGVYREWFNPTGTRIVTNSFNDYSVMIWDADTGKQVGDALQHEGPVKEIRFNPAGTQMVIVSRGKFARIWDTSNGQPLGDALHHERGIDSASFNQDGSQIVTVGYDDTARIWDAGTAKRVGDILKHEATIYHADFSSDGTRVVTASIDDTVRIWDAGTGQPVGVSLQHEDDVKYASFSPAGTHIVTSGDFYIRIWEIETGLSVGKPTLREVPGTHVSFNPAGTHIVATGLGFTRTWDATWLTQYPDREDLVRAVCHKWGADVTTLTVNDVNEPLISADRVGEDACPSHD